MEQIEMAPADTQRDDADDAATQLRVIPLGGLGGIGKNMMLIESGENILIIDAGLMFPDSDMHGVDVVIHGHYHFTLHARVGGSPEEPAGTEARTGEHTDARTERTGELVVLGDWIRKYTYAVLENGGIRLDKWNQGTLSEPATRMGEDE